MIIVALGANLPSRYGSPEKTLVAAVDALSASYDIEVVQSSRIWRSAPVPVSDQPWYCNSVVCVETGHDPLELLSVLSLIEVEFGRVRTQRNAPRVIDLDLIDYDGLVMDEEGLCLPHPRMFERGFVLRPLFEVAPEWVHPVSGVGIDDLLCDLPQNEEIYSIESDENV